MKKIIDRLKERNDRRLRKKIALRTPCDYYDVYGFIVNPFPEARYLTSRLYTWRKEIPTLAQETMEFVTKRIEDYKKAIPSGTKAL